MSPHSELTASTSPTCACWARSSQQHPHRPASLWVSPEEGMGTGQPSQHHVLLCGLHFWEFFHPEAHSPRTSSVAGSRAEGSQA